MNNTDLFEFVFVDRENETKQIKKILKEKTQNVIWIYGKHGVGKSYFIDHIIGEIPTENVVYIELKSEEKSIKCIQILLEKIEAVTNISFLSYFQKNYKTISKLVQGVISSIIEYTTGMDISSLAEVILDSDRLFMNNNNQQQNNLKLIISYLNSILEKQDLLIIIDNFFLCDSQSLDLLINIFQYYKINNHYKIFFILCTSDNGNKIEYQLQEKVALEPIELKSFDDYNYFYDILIKIFKFTPDKINMIKQIFEFCEGNPAQLKTFIHMLYSDGGIKFDEIEDRAIWKDAAVEKIIYNNCHEYKVKEMNYTKQLILYVIVEFQKILTIDLLIDLVSYLRNKRCFIGIDFSEREIYEAVLNLKQDGIILIFHEQNKFYVKIEHDLKYYSFKAQFSTDSFMPQINGIFFEYIIHKKEILLSQGLKENLITELLAWHSYYGKVSNWMTYNCELGNQQYQHGDYKSSAKTFERLDGNWSFLDNNQKLIIGRCFFFTGKYSLANRVLKSIADIEETIAYDYYLLLAQVNNILFDKEKAIEIIDNNLMNVCFSELQWLESQNLKQRILSNIGTMRNESKIIFDNIKSKISPSIKKTAIYGKFLMSTIEFYRGHNADTDLKEVEKIAISTNNQYLLAILYTNKGFHEFWQGKIEVAKEDFKFSKEKLASIRMHEMAYPLNNLGVCYLMEGKIDTALTCFQTGLLWNQSRYVDITLKTMLMVCYAIKKNDFCFALIEELKNVLNTPNITDISIHLKVTYSIGFVYKCYGDMENYDRYIQKSFKIALKSSNNALPYIWFEKYDKKIQQYIDDNIDSNKYASFYQLRFEPWLVTLNHD